MNSEKILKFANYSSSKNSCLTPFLTRLSSSSNATSNRQISARRPRDGKSISAINTQLACSTHSCRCCCFIATLCACAFPLYYSMQRPPARLGQFGPSGPSQSLRRGNWQAYAASYRSHSNCAPGCPMGSVISYFQARKAL